MSTLKAEIVEVDIEEHPNADRLEVARPRGKAWQCVTEKDTYKSGDLAVYLPIDSVLPDALVEKLNIAKYYSKRLRTVKLRGMISQGMLAPLSILPPTKDNRTEVIVVGADMTELLGITKYDPPIPVEMAGKVRPADGRFIRYTDIENYKNYPDVFEDGEPVIITEKIHGTNGRAANIDGDLHVGSHRMDFIETESNLYWRGAALLDIKNKLKPGEQVFFEVYGYNVQDLRYGKNPGEISVAVFDLMKDGVYLNNFDFITALEERGWLDFQAPPIFLGPWSKMCLDIANGRSIISEDTIREGFVVKPINGGDNVALQGRKILKVISDKYLLRKDATERH